LVIDELGHSCSVESQEIDAKTSSEEQISIKLFSDLMDVDESDLSHDVKSQNTDHNTPPSEEQLSNDSIKLYIDAMDIDDQEIFTTQFNSNAYQEHDVNDSNQTRINNRDGSIRKRNYKSKRNFRFYPYPSQRKLAMVRYEESAIIAVGFTNERQLQIYH
jgi:hypothetical protein